jgi:glycine betaine catabolism B
VHVLGGPVPAVPRPGRYVLPLLEARRESPSAITFRFSTEGTGFQYLAQQAIRVALPGVEDPWGPVRTFSLSSSPSELGEIAVTARISDTPFKQALARLAPGDTAEIVGPLGLFQIDLDRTSVFLAAGIGITPFRGMLRYAADLGDQRERRLLYVARSPEELLFRSELDRLASEFPQFGIEYSITRPEEAASPWTGRVGRIDEAWMRATAARLDRPKFYVGGRPEMVEPTLAVLAGPMGVPEADVDYEVFRGF